ncbi:MAG: heme peroxidase [Acidobacteriia bacterium]|nr:heme peroxidase [Terriglobia bacterium]
MSARHGKPLRGLMSTKTSPLFQGRFGRMFRSLPAAKYGKDEAESRTNLMTLGDLMTSDFDAPKDAPDAEESGIPALYTYFGQFIDHDITFDPMSSLIQHTDPDALTDFRTPAFDLDNVYGRGPDDQPYIYDGHTFLLGDIIGGGNDPHAQDLPRNNANPRRALIGDPRNDENSIVSQLQGLFLRFHNRTVKDHPEIDPGTDFARLQKIVRFHYQFVVLNDFLPRIVHSSVLADLKTNGHYDRHKLRFFHWKDEPFMPVEFSVAAYRLGHSMIRPGYRLNDAVLLPIFPVSKKIDPPDGLPDGLTGFRAMNPFWGIDWGRFIDVDIRSYGSDTQPPDGPTKKRLQFAYRLDTSLVTPLSDLPPSVATNPPSLPQRNLLRSFELSLPNGQDVARAMHVTPLKDNEIMIGKAVDSPETGDVRGTIASIPKLSVFHGNCPLWTYILAEAARNPEPVKIPVQEDKTITTPRLGPVGGRIVAEVFLGMMFGDNDSLLNLDPHWQPSSGPDYKLKDFVKYALGS